MPADRGEGSIVLWRDGLPIAISPKTKAVTSLGDGFEAKPGSLQIGPDGKLLVYYRSNARKLRPLNPKEGNRVYVRDGNKLTEISPGVGLGASFWGPDGKMYGFGWVLPKEDTDPPPDLTADNVNWSFTPRSGEITRLKLPGNVSIFGITPDGKTFLVVHYEKTPKAPGAWPDHRIGTIPITGGEFAPWTGTDEHEISVDHLRFSPDGRYALSPLRRSFPQPTELGVFELKSPQTRRIIPKPKDARVWACCWSPDGKHIAFIWESQFANSERIKNQNAGRATSKPIYTITVARSDGSEAKNIYTESEYEFGSIEWVRDSPPKPEPQEAPK